MLVGGLAHGTGGTKGEQQKREVVLESERGGLLSHVYALFISIKQTATAKNFDVQSKSLIIKVLRVAQPSSCRTYNGKSWSFFSRIVPCLTPNPLPALRLLTSIQ